MTTSDDDAYVSAVLKARLAVPDKVIVGEVDPEALVDHLPMPESYGSGSQSASMSPAISTETSLGIRSISTAKASGK